MIVNNKRPMGFASKIRRKRVARFWKSLEGLASDEAGLLNERERNFFPRVVEVDQVSSGRRRKAKEKWRKVEKHR